MLDGSFAMSVKCTPVGHVMATYFSVCVFRASVSGRLLVRAGDEPLDASRF